MARVGFFKRILPAPRRRDYSRDAWRPAKRLENACPVE
jgi:hypothetical protein